ncbi:MAG: sigma-70 family RNA polymerase sigma factor, partial [Clostridia bacterium]|nr:sigma-70 family RNA polymerase sigma factor [Clostridia bacterium]
MPDNTALMERVLKGDKQAENTMVEQNMGLVHSIARRFSGRGYELDDLIQIGAIGLIKAVKKFNPDFEVQFSTYAVPMIMGEIKRFLRDDGAVKISRTLKETALKGRRCEEILRRRLCREPTISEVAEESGIPAQNLVEAFDAAAPPGSIYENV